MALKDIFKVSRKTFFAPSAWLGYQDLKSNSVFIWSTLKALFIVPTPDRQETFNEAKARLKLSEEDIQEAETNYFFNAMLFLGCAILSLVGGVLLLIRYHSFASLVLATATAAIFGAQAFRNHFLYFQIKTRKLGCTYQEWKKFFYKSVGVKE